MEASWYSPQSCSCEEHSNSIDENEKQNMKLSVHLLKQNGEGREENPHAAQHEAVVDPEVFGIDESLNLLKDIHLHE